LGIKYEINNRSALGELELDVYIPSHNLAIEYHGLYWHSYGRLETSEERKRHQQKAIKCVSSNIDLFQIYDFEWSEKNEIVKSMILNKLKLSKKLNARSCKLAKIDNNEATDFFNNNHLYGHRTASFYYALTLDNKIVACTSFSKHKDGYELIRLASSVGYMVRGGFNKLLHAFKEDIKPSVIYTYADLRYSKGISYSSSGFTLIKITDPGYFYYKQSGDDYNILSRHQCQKGKLGRLLSDFNPDTSESANMFANGYRRVWDAGHLLFQQRSDRC
jgi:hypothetical protein